jgi:hypothetical protein
MKTGRPVAISATPPATLKSSSGRFVTDHSPAGLRSPARHAGRSRLGLQHQLRSSHIWRRLSEALALVRPYCHQTAKLREGSWSYWSLSDCFMARPVVAVIVLCSPPRGAHPHDGSALRRGPRAAMGIDRPRRQATLRRAPGHASARRRRDENRELTAHRAGARLPYPGAQVPEARLSADGLGLAISRRAECARRAGSD